MSLNILPLSLRREVNDLVFLFKYLKGFISADFSSFIEMCTFNNRRDTGPVVILKSPIIRTETFMGSFFNRVCHLWNILPLHVRTSNSIVTFKKNVNCFYTSKMEFYDIDNSCTFNSTCRCSGFYHH